MGARVIDAARRLDIAQRRGMRHIARPVDARCSNSCVVAHNMITESRELFMRRIVVTAFAVSCLAAMASSAVNAGVVGGGNDDELVPTGKGWGERPAPGPGPGEGAGQGQGQPQGNGKPTRQGSNGISYHGGPVMTNGSNVYYIWYGNWSGNTATTILADLASSMGG